MAIKLLLFALFINILYGATIEECTKDPSNPDCKGLEYPASLAYSDLDNLCNAMPWMPGCTFLSLCKKAGNEASEYCHPLSLLNDICIADRMGGMTGCKTYTRLCAPSSSVVEFCFAYPAIPKVVTTREVKMFSQELCLRSGESASPKCSSCDLSKPRECDYTSIYSDICLRNAGKNFKECARWSEMCSTLHDSPALSNLCVNQLVSSRLNSFLEEETDCISNSSSAACSDYFYPQEMIEKDLDSLCLEMSCMPGCSLRNTCKNNGLTDGPCTPMQVLADICVGDDMLGMDGCYNYGELCKEGSKVAQCSLFPNIKTLPTTSSSEVSIQKMCASHYMEDCPTGNLQCGAFDYLMVYSKLCKSMPEMSRCVEWQNFCEDEAFSSVSDEYCKYTANDPPVMRMYFHFGLADYILFKEWVPRNDFQYWLSFIAIVLVGIFYELLVTVRIRLEYEWDRENRVGRRDADDTPDTTESSETKFLLLPGFKNTDSGRYRFCWRAELCRGGLQFLETTLSYSLMLIAMTFNVYLFFAVPVGISLGAVLFGRFRESPKKPSCC